MANLVLGYYGFPGHRVRTQNRFKSRLPDDWLLYAALLPMVLTLVGIILTAATGVGAVNARLNVGYAAVVSKADDYVRGLMRLGIVQLPPALQHPINDGP
jgi:hypothetical protein